MGKTLVLVTVMVLGGTHVVLAEVNCDLVRRYARVGRTVSEMAEIMVAPEAEVKACLEAKKRETSPPPRKEKK